MTIIWNHNEKCIKISTNMPDIGLELYSIFRIWKTNLFCFDGETNGPVQSIKRTVMNFTI